MYPDVPHIYIYIYTLPSLAQFSISSQFVPYYLSLDLCIFTIIYLYVDTCTCSIAMYSLVFPCVPLSSICFPTFLFSGVALLRGAGATCGNTPGAGSAAPGLRAACIEWEDGRDIFDPPKIGVLGFHCRFCLI